MHISAIVLAAGRGLRFKTKISKPLIKLKRQPIIIYCLSILSKHPYIKDIVVIANPQNLNGIVDKIKQYRIGKIKDVVLGGSQRRDSVINGLKAVDSQTDLILIHDGVRPFINKGNISSVIREAGRFGAAVLGVPVKATIKSVVSCQLSVVSKTLDRKNLWEIQTPQAFKKDIILEAYKKFGNLDITDDASLVEKLGRQVRVVKGSYFNIKITTPEDLILAEAIARRWNTE